MKMSDSRPFPWFTWKRLAVAGALALVAIHYWPQTVTPPAPYDQFYYAVAINFTAPEFCGKITRHALGGGGGFSPKGYQTKYLRSECFYDLAQATKNPDLCTEVIPLNQMFLDGSKISKAGCLENMASNSLTGTSPPPNLREIMNKMGYSDRDVAEFKDMRYAVHPRLDEFYTQTKDDPDYLTRLNQQPNYEEPIAENRTRPAHSAEYLYDTVALDKADRSLCNRISPNAYYEGNGMKFSLRSHCLFGLAVNARDASACSSVPSRGGYGLANNYFCSESCLKEISYWGKPEPIPFHPYKGVILSQAEDLSRALADLGYNNTSPIPEATDDDYRDFYRSLIYSPQKSEFLRRAAVLK